MFPDRMFLSKMFPDKTPSQKTSFTNHKTIVRECFLTEIWSDMMVDGRNYVEGTLGREDCGGME